MLDVIAFLSVASPICVRRLCFVSIAWSPVVLVSPRGGRNGRLNRRLGRLNRQFSRSSRIELVRLSLVRIVVVSPQFRCYVVSIFVQPLPSSYRFMYLYFSEFPSLLGHSYLGSSVQFSLTIDISIVVTTV